MIIIVQLVVIIVALTLAMYSIVGRQTYTARAWKKIALCLLAIAMIVAVIFPDITNQMAQLVGIGRGADLLLYGLTLVFILYAINDYVRNQKERDSLHRLARKLALLEADIRYNPKK